MFYIYIILGILFIHCSIYYLNIDVFQFIKTKTKNKDANVVNKNSNVNGESQTNDLSISIETSINELKNLNQYIDNELGQTTFC